MAAEASARATRSGFLPDRTVHLHAARRCNLACAHCYSSSSPYADEALGEDDLERALAVLRDEGYELLSLSGGEPLLHPRLGELVDHAHDLGYRVVALSNGYRIKPSTDPLVERIDGVTISFDGLDETHNRMRGRADSFDVAVGALKHLREIGRPSAAAYTVTRESMDEIPEFVELAVSLGVRAVHLRPLAMAGRAVDKCGGLALGPIDRSRLFLIGAGLAELYADEVAIHTDLAPAPALVAQRHAYDALLEGPWRGRPLADLVNPLVVTPSGAVKPFTYDFPDGYDLGAIDALAGRGAQMLAGNLLALRRLVGALLDELEGSHALIDWFVHCRDQADARAPAFAGA